MCTIHASVVFLLQRCGAVLSTAYCKNRIFLNTNNITLCNTNHDGMVFDESASRKVCRKVFQAMLFKKKTFVRFLRVSSSVSPISTIIYHRYLITTRLSRFLFNVRKIKFTILFKRSRVRKGQGRRRRILLPGPTAALEIRARPCVGTRVRRADSKKKNVRRPSAKRIQKTPRRERRITPAFPSGAYRYTYRLIVSRFSFNHPVVYTQYTRIRGVVRYAKCGSSGRSTPQRTAGPRVPSFDPLPYPPRALSLCTVSVVSVSARRAFFRQNRFVPLRPRMLRKPVT